MRTLCCQIILAKRPVQIGIWSFPHPVECKPGIQLNLRVRMQRLPYLAPVRKHRNFFSICHIAIRPVNLRHHIIHISFLWKPRINICPLTSCIIRISCRTDSELTVWTFLFDRLVYFLDKCIYRLHFFFLWQRILHAVNKEIIIKMNTIHWIAF